MFIFLQNFQCEYLASFFCKACSRFLHRQGRLNNINLTKQYHSNDSLNPVVISSIYHSFTFFKFVQLYTWQKQNTIILLYSFLLLLKNMGPWNPETNSHRPLENGWFGRWPSPEGHVRFRTIPPKKNRGIFLVIQSRARHRSQRLKESTFSELH